MEIMDVQELKIDDLVAFRHCSHKTYEGERFEQLMTDIEKTGQLHPIIVRSFCDGEYKKYEVISGHNRVRAMKALGHVTVLAEVRYNLSDHDAIKLFYEIKLSKQPFPDWSYSQKIEAVRFYEKVIKEYSCQGKRTDLEEKKICGTEDGIFDQGRQKLAEETGPNIESRQKLAEETGQNIESRQKLAEKSEPVIESRQKLAEESEQIIESRQKLTGKTKRLTTRDKIACYLGISTSKLSQFRSIVKLPENLADCMGKLLDRKMITFQAAYMISKSELNDSDVKRLLRCIEKSPDKKVDKNALKLLLSRRKSKRNDNIIYSRYDDEFEQILIPKNSK